MLILFILLPFIIIGIQIICYTKSTYFKLTQNPFFTTYRDTGKYGEYLTYKCLRKIENTGAKFLFNIYIPKENGETTEIDVLLISKKGIFVFESKNYSGWIFGDAIKQNWVQTLPVGKGKSRKEYFFNPIMQNKMHIKYLKKIINYNIPLFSIIVFSDRCTLKNVPKSSSDYNIVKRSNLPALIASAYNNISNDVLNMSEINDIYNQLYPYTQVSQAIKKQHIETINSKKNTKYN